MTARKCFEAKIAAGMISKRAGGQVLDMLDKFEKEYQARLGDAAGARQAELEMVELVKATAIRKADDARDAIVQQVKVLRVFEGYMQVAGQLKETTGDMGWGTKAPVRVGRQDKPLTGFALGSLLARDPYEIATWTNVEKVAEFVRGEAHRRFQDGIEFLRNKALGFKAEITREVDVLRALYGEAGVSEEAKRVAQSWTDMAKWLSDSYRGVGGRLGELEDWLLPNPPFDPNKARALGADRMKALIREHVDRSKMKDWATGEVMSDHRFEELLNDAVERALEGYTGKPSGAYRGSAMLANSRDAHRVFTWKSSDSWLAIAQNLGTFESPWEAMIQHVHGMSNDIAMMRMLGRNPENTKRFMLSLFEKEARRLSVEAPAGASEAEIRAAKRRNDRITGDLASERRRFENIWAEVSGENRVPVDVALAERFANVRHWLGGVDLGSALISSWGDLATVTMTARLSGLPVTRVLGRAIELMRDLPGMDIFGAQMGLTMDSIAHVAGTQDRLMGETTRSGIAAKVSSAAIRLSGLRRWSQALRISFATEMAAEMARARTSAFAELEPRLRERFARYGIGENDWDVIRATNPWEPRTNALLLRPVDVLEGGSAAHMIAAEKYSHMMNNEMNYALVDRDAFTRAMLLGGSVPGTWSGELRRSAVQYRSYPATVITMHLARAAARGWDGSRLGHGALTFAAMTVIGMASLQFKEMARGRDPLNFDPTTGIGARTWGKAILQGGGLGIFGDMLFIDQTRHGNTWAGTLAGPLAGRIEAIAGDFILKNIQLAAKGEKTHWLGDAAYTAAQYVPGSSLWFGRLAFQRGVLDQLALMIDDRARERFRRIEDTARKEFGQRYWWGPGRTAPTRAPELGAMLPGR